LLNGHQQQALEWLLDAEQDQWLFFQPVLTSPVYAEFREIPEVAESLARMVDWRAGVLDELMAVGLPEVEDPSILLELLESLLTPTLHERAQMALHFEDDPAGALRHYADALEKAPEDLAIIGQMADLVLEFGLVDEAIALSQRAVALSPLNSNAHFDLAFAYACAERWIEAIASVRTSLELDPDADWLQRWLGMMLMLNNEPQAAMEVFRQIPDGWQRSMGLVLAHYALGQQAESDAILAEWLKEGVENTPYNLAYTLAYRGDTDLAFEWLYKAATLGPWVSTAAVHPFLLKLHADPRWLPFLESIGRSPEQLAAIEFKIELPE
jgi:tetratricopeptide (TPR) repeat protein